MVEDLEKKRVGHQASTTRTFSRVNVAFVAKAASEAKLSQQKLMLEEKLGTLKLLNSDIVELTEEEALAMEIE